MQKTRFWSITAAILGMTLGAVGCGGGTPAPAGAGTGGGHTHTHAGPHKGHVMVLGKEEYHAEWTQDETGKVTFYILDSEAKKDVPIEAKEITIDVKIGQNPPKTFTLPALNPQDGKTAAFEIVDTNLEGALDQIKGTGVVCTLHVNINGKQFDQEIKEEEHTDDHGK